MDLLEFGLYYYSKITETTGEENFKDQVFEVTGQCIYYDESKVNMDAAWKVARAFALIAPLFAGVLVLGLLVAPCCIFYTPNTWNMMAYCFLLVVPGLQSLTLLILASNACKNNPIIESLLEQMINSMDSGSGSVSSLPNSVNSTAADEGDGDSDSSNNTSTIDSDTEARISLYPEECEWSWGTYANIVSLCLFFMTGLFMLIMGPPTRPRPPEPEVQTVTYEQKSDDNNETTVDVVDVKTESISPGSVPPWASTNPTMPVPANKMEVAKPY